MVLLQWCKEYGICMSGQKSGQPQQRMPHYAVSLHEKSQAKVATVFAVMKLLFDASSFANSAEGRAREGIEC